MTFGNIFDWIIPEGSVERVADSLGIVIWEKEGHNYSKDYFFIENLTNQNNTLSIIKRDTNAPTVTVYKSTDTVNWESMGSTSTTGITATIPANGRLYLRATANQWGAQTFKYNNRINCTGNYRVGGNIMSLLAGDNFANAVLDTQYTYQFTYLFYSSTTLINAANLILPANVTEGCYNHTFQGCSGLVSAPALPATTLDDYCYTFMFSSCTSLTTTPALPATTLATGCYSQMFSYCPSLTTAPVLPATALAQSCYNEMFRSCTSLNEVTTYADDISATNCLFAWLYDVAPAGNFYNLGTATYPVNSGNGIPTGWTEHTLAESYFYVEDISGNNTTLSIKKYNSSAPTIEVFCSTDQTNWTSMGNTDTTPITATVPANGKLYLKATANAWCTSGSSDNEISVSDKYNVGGNIMSLLNGDNFEGTTFTNSNSYAFPYLFEQDNNLVNANELILPSNVVNSCYQSMFEDCTSLTSAPALPATTLAENCYNMMFWKCTSLTTAPALPATTLAEQCYQSMFYGCTGLTSAPALPATTLANYCYTQMFQDCISLTTAPALPATTLANYCYTQMFQGCTSLNEVTIYADDISATSCLFTWLKNVAATGDFYNLGSATYPSGASGIPTGWTEHNTL